MLPPCWTETLTRTLSRLTAAVAPNPLRVAVVGLGHPLRGDDAAGSVVAQRLAARLPLGGPVLVLDAGPAPESFTGRLRRHAPQLVLLIDAAHLDLAPGTVRWLPWEETAGLSATTHTLPLHVLARFLTLDLNCEVAVLGLQPADLTLDAPLSPALAQAVADVTAALAEALTSLPV